MYVYVCKYAPAKCHTNVLLAKLTLLQAYWSTAPSCSTANSISLLYVYKCIYRHTCIYKYTYVNIHKWTREHMYYLHYSLYCRHIGVPQPTAQQQILSHSQRTSMERSSFVEFCRGRVFLFFLNMPHDSFIRDMTHSQRKPAERATSMEFCHKRFIFTDILRK